MISWFSFFFAFFFFFSSFFSFSFFFSYSFFIIFTSFFVLLNFIFLSLSLILMISFNKLSDEAVKLAIFHFIAFFSFENAFKNFPNSCMTSESLIAFNSFSSSWCKMRYWINSIVNIMNLNMLAFSSFSSAII